MASVLLPGDPVVKSERTGSEWFLCAKLAVMVRELKPPFPPMEAISAAEIPVGGAWQYEPKWDGFRCLAFKNGKQVELQSKLEKRRVIGEGHLPLPSLVAEVPYDHFTGGRFRHGAKFVRWRPDKKPEACSMVQPG